MSKSELNCSFCGKPKSDTELLIAGLDAHICNSSINQAHGILVEESSEQESNSVNIEL